MPIAAKTGVASVEVGAGLAVCAARQIVQVAFSLWLGWLWVDSTTTVHSSKDRHSHAQLRNHERIAFPTRLRLLKAYNGYLIKSKVPAGYYG